MQKRRYAPGDFKLERRRSAAGLGLFAGEDIPKGACVIEYFGPYISNEEADRLANKYLFAISTRRTIDGSPRANEARYINHSCRPNCEADVHKGRVFIFARRAIKAGEELAYNYGKDYFDSYIKPHGCRCPKCTAQRAAAEGAAR